jgi:hypothetical protein
MATDSGGCTVVEWALCAEEGRCVTIYVTLSGAHVPVERGVFTALLGESVVSGRKPYTQALSSSTIAFDMLVELARKAEIPYALFFAPQAVVDRQIKKKLDTLLAGVSKDTFSMNSRSRVRLRDVELIVKDLLRKQETLKKLDDKLAKNAVVGSLKNSRRTVTEDADKLRAALGFAVADIKAAKTKEAALDLLISRFESKQMLVSQSQLDYMPQRLPRGVKFSGLCVRDKKIPFVFLTGGDAGDNPEPVGRKVFTLVLLAVLVARGRFAPVTYDDYTCDPIETREYELTEEILMPTAEVVALDVSTLDAVKACAAVYKVTPSAFTMRARRLQLVDRDTAADYLGQLAAAFAQRPKQRAGRATPVNGVRRYAGPEYVRRMFTQLDHGRIGSSEFRRVVCLNMLTRGQLDQLRATR